MKFSFEAFCALASAAAAGLRASPDVKSADWQIFEGRSIYFELVLWKIHDKGIARRRAMDMASELEGMADYFKKYDFNDELVQGQRPIIKWNGFLDVRQIEDDGGWGVSFGFERSRK